MLNNDATLTSALLDRLLYHAETVRITGKSFRTKKANKIKIPRPNDRILDSTAGAASLSPS